MYAFIEGTVEHKSTNDLVIAVGGVGYQIQCTQAALSNAPPRGEVMRVYTWLSVREDALELFGFHSLEEKQLFLKLNGITGIGPRTALGILGAMPLADLTLAIMTGDTVMLSRAPGIGKKTAQRIALELKDKLSPEDFSSDQPFGLNPGTGQEGAVAEAILALQSLGYTQSEAVRAVSLAHQGAQGDEKADSLVRLALRGMTKG
ncbi:MAG: Holliday junction branch migration protein RuvA [Christensenellales bacterium]